VSPRISTSAVAVLLPRPDDLGMVSLHDELHLLDALARAARYASPVPRWARSRTSLLRLGYSGARAFASLREKKKARYFPTLKTVGDTQNNADSNPLPSDLRVPEHREHRFRSIVNGDSESS
jgi:hypothetical protein